ncbi:MAG: hypothetical protein HYY20_08720 [Candidatus Tectomicrobia bacterium]|uniref:Uncharacterized protein n=1 Tax=Tectimicrobiota bacterium TaxID=2528274 RepID=A0A932CPV6_UNCTE|nr:hypothetical protein [Candidatus Tectomicrobia bacterium]
MIGVLLYRYLLFFFLCASASQAQAFSPIGQPGPREGETGNSFQGPFATQDGESSEEKGLAAEFSGSMDEALSALEEDPRHRFQGNLRLFSPTLEKEFESTLKGDLRFVDEEDPGTDGPALQRADLGSWLFTLRYKRNQIEAGDLRLWESSLLTQPNLVRRGIRASTDLLGTELHLFTLHPQSILGLRRGAGGDLPKQRLQGASLSRQILPDGALRWKATFLTGEYRSPSDASAGSTYSLLATSSLFQGQLQGEGEVAFSRFALGSHPLSSPAGDHAWRIRVGGKTRRIHLDSEYQRVGRDFTSLAHPSLQKDQAGFTLSAYASLEPVGLALNFSQTHDNIEKSLLSPRVTQNLLGATFSMGLPARPALSFTYTRSEQNSSLEPDTMAPFRVITDTFAGKLSYSRPTWSASLIPSLSLQDAREGAPNDVAVLNITARSSVTPSSSLALVPSLSFTRVTNRDSDRSTGTLLATLAGSVILIPEMLAFETQSSLNRTRTDHGLTDRWSFNSLARISFNFGQFLFHHGRQALSLKVNYHQTYDRVVPTDHEEGVGFYLTYEIFTPSSLLPLSRWGKN